MPFTILIIVFFHSLVYTILAGLVGLSMILAGVSVVYFGYRCPITMTGIILSVVFVRKLRSEIRRRRGGDSVALDEANKGLK